MSSNLLTGNPGIQADFITCDLCTAALPLIKPLLPLPIEEEVIIQVISFICVVLGLAPRDDVCEPTIRSYAVIMTHFISLTDSLSFLI